MWKKIIITPVLIAATGFGLLYLFTLPLLRRLPSAKRVALDGITTIEDAIKVCQRSKLVGWELVEYAQKLTARKFSYSRRNPWDTPAQAFARGRGYCEQQTMALRQIYDGLGVESWPVFSLTCQFGAGVADGMPTHPKVSGHAWLKVRLGDEERDVCPGDVTNRPGVINFKVLGRVYKLTFWLRPFTWLGSVITNIIRDNKARQEFANKTPPKEVVGLL